MKKSTTFAALGAIGLSGLMLVGVGAPAFAAEFTTSASSSGVAGQVLQTTATAATEWVDPDPNWGDDGSEIGSEIRVYNNTNDTITVDFTRGRVVGSTTLQPGEWMYAENYSTGSDVIGSVAVGDSTISLESKSPSWGTPWVKVGGNQLYASNETNKYQTFTVDGHELSVGYNGLSSEDCSKFTVVVNS